MGDILRADERALAGLRNPGVKMREGAEGSEKAGGWRSFGKTGRQQEQPGGEASQGRDSLRMVNGRWRWG